MQHVVSSAAAIPGWMDVAELEWLAFHASRRLAIVELGSWKGRSTKALAGATPGVVWAVDHWSGSADAADDTFKEIQRDGAEAVFIAFMANLSNEIAVGKVVPVRASGLDATHWLSQHLPGGCADMIFIDAEHRYEAVRRDLDAFLPLLARGGVICGHDHDPYWPGVVRAVDETFRHCRKGPGSIWYVEG
jgi:predicted O-methyltransferase YrrM